jgi:hypothetical protein
METWRWFFSKRHLLTALLSQVILGRGDRTIKKNKSFGRLVIGGNKERLPEIKIDVLMNWGKC